MNNGIEDARACEFCNSYNCKCLASKTLDWLIESGYPLNNAHDWAVATTTFAGDAVRKREIEIANDLDLYFGVPRDQEIGEVRKLVRMYSKQLREGSAEGVGIGQ